VSKFRRSKHSVCLLSNTDIAIADRAVGTCWDKQKDEVDLGRLDRVVNQFKHGSTVEHLVYTFTINDLSRAAIQELARHRIASLSVESSRYTLSNKLIHEKPFKSRVDRFITPTLINPTEVGYNPEDESFKDVYSFKCQLEEDEIMRAQHYLYFVGNDLTDVTSIEMLEQLRFNLRMKTSNDIAKYNIPESFLTKLVYTINARSLQNLLTLRSSKSALLEIQDLAMCLFKQLPLEHKFLYVDSIFQSNYRIYHYLKNIKSFRFLIYTGKGKYIFTKDTTIKTGLDKLIDKMLFNSNLRDELQDIIDNTPNKVMKIFIKEVMVWSQRLQRR